jgi:hypothetical protein
MVVFLELVEPSDYRSVNGRSQTDSSPVNVGPGNVDPANVRRSGK